MSREGKFYIYKPTDTEENKSLGSVFFTPGKSYRVEREFVDSVAVTDNEGDAHTLTNAYLKKNFKIDLEPQTDMDRYLLLGREVKYQSPFIFNWEVFDFDNFQKILNEMKDLQKKLKQK